MSGTLALSSHIASLDRAALVELVRDRHIAAMNSVNDPIDLATELLKPESIAQALSRLHISDLLRLSDGGTAPAPHLIARGLLAPDFSPLPEVTHELTQALEARGLTPDRLRALEREALELSRTAPTHAPDTSSWYAAALGATTQAAWILRELVRAPAKLNRNGSIASAWVKNIDERLHIPHADELIDLIRNAGLAVAAGQELVATPGEWLDIEHAERWRVLADASRMLMPPQVMSLLDRRSPNVLAGRLAERLRAEFPLSDAATIAQTETVAVLWERLGVTVGGGFSDAGMALVSDSFETAHLALPETIAAVYVQPDLTVVVPGPLSASDEAQLSALTVPEHLGVASTLRFTEASLTAALNRGLGPHDIRDFLTRISSTGIPQPLEYLITTLGERSGSIVVSRHDGDDGRTRVDFVRQDVRATVGVDRNLAHLQLQEPGGVLDTESAVPPLISRLRPDHVLTALIDARYPATAGEGVKVSADPPPHRRVTAPETAATANDPRDALVERVLSSASSGANEVTRLLTLAIRDRMKLRVTAEVRGVVREFSVLPVSLAAGRLRALDEAAGVERTLPLDAVTEVTQLE